MVDTIIENGMIIDGTGSPGYHGTVLISGEQVNIVRGDLPDIKAGRVIDATGLLIQKLFY